MKNLELILSEIASVRTVADKDPELLPYATRAAHEIAIREAKERLVALNAEYKAQLTAVTTVFFLSGPDDKVAAFIEEAQKAVANTFTAKPSEVYSELTAKVEETMAGGREFGANQFASLLNAQRDIAVREGVDRMDMPNLTEIRNCPTTDDLREYIRDLVRASSGDTLAYLNTRNRLFEAAIQSKCTATSVALLVANPDSVEREALSKGFAGSSAIEIPSDAEVNESFVIDVFEKRAGQRKPNRAKKQNKEEQK